VSYLRSSHEVRPFPDDVFSCTSLEEFERRVDLLPHALFSLYLVVESIGDAGAEALASSPFLKHLTYLYIGSNGIGKTGVRALRGSATLAGCDIEF